MSTAAFAQTAPTPVHAAPTQTASSQTAPTTSTHTPKARTATPRTTAPLPTAPVNVNTATAAQLMTLPGVSNKIAAEIIKDRPYKNAAELVKKVKGIGKNNVKPMTPYLAF
ncbi:hypothetical protein HAV23_03915 [Deinococcus radiodurans]|nr:hypothetical protein HAV23_03915 [Deinococcus radiodurans]QIP33145.1 hypothetical protein HAV35_12910 [Deinococcus radiodurans]